MADIFISYAREDRHVAERLAHLLEEQVLDGQKRWEVFWDREILPGAAFVDVIAAELKAARHVIALWSRNSVESRWVRDEAQEGLDRNVLVPVLIEAVAPPLGFRSIHSLELAGWNLDPLDPRFQELVAVLKGERPAPLPTLGKRGRPFLRRPFFIAAAAVLVFSAGAVLVYLYNETVASRQTFRPRTDEMPEGHQAFARFKDCPDCPGMVAIPPGSFVMGASRFESDAQSDEKPWRVVDIKTAFAMGEHEVTFGEWLACVADGGCGGYRPDDEGWGEGKHPVIYVSWNQAQQFVQWLSGKTGKEYRLPNEAEWEYACRAGTRTKYAFGDSIGPDQASFGRNTGRTREAGSYQPNAWGLYDMHGNVWEWVEDVWFDSHSGRPDDGRARTEGPDPDNRTVRGGSWDDPERRVRCLSRNHKDRDQRENEIGFRVARSL
jgi:formylglycine-generating enzyme required for sulfatase activity